MNPPNTFNIEVLCLKNVVYFNRGQKYSVMIKKRFENYVPIGSFSVMTKDKGGFRIDTVEEFLQYFEII